MKFRIRVPAPRRETPAEVLRRHLVAATSTTELRRRLACERGATTVEYGLMIAGLAIGLILVIGGFMEALDFSFDRTIDGIRD